MKKLSIVLFCALAMPLSGMAQTASSAFSTISTQYQDSLASIMQRYSRPMTYNAELDPYMYQMMSSDTYYSDSLHDMFTIGADSTRQTAINQATMMAYLDNPGRYSKTEEVLYASEADKTPAEPNVEKQPSIVVSNMKKVDTPQLNTVFQQAETETPKFWSHSCNVYFQFSQSYVSSDWYKGGESSNTMLTGLTLEANYDNQDKIRWENKAEIKVGFISSKADSLHKFKTNNDLFRLTSKFGYKATKNWYYTVLGTMDNQFFPGYKTNDTRIFSNFLSPMKLNVSVGMDFKKAKEKKYDVSLALLPFSMNYVYVSKDEVLQNSYPGFDGKHSDLKLGSRIQLDHQVYFAKNIKWTSMFYMFTSYHNVESMWENTLDFAVNKVLSAKIFLNGRYDDINTGKRIQLNESLSFGVSYNL